MPVTQICSSLLLDLCDAHFKELYKVLFKMTAYSFVRKEQMDEVLTKRQDTEEKISFSSTFASLGTLEKEV